MGNLFSVDGPLYKFCTVIYNLLVLNFLWFLFSIPFFTIGASTTALFYVSGKIVRKENIQSLTKSYWKSFKKNFKQATITWLILLLMFSITLMNLLNMHLIGPIAKFLTPFQFIIMIQIVIISVYIFPLISRYHMKILDYFKVSFFIANRHFITTILCLAIFPGIYYLFLWQWFFIFFPMSIYSFWVTFLIKDKFKKYENETNEE